MKSKFEALVSREPAKWQADAKWRAENKDWLKNSQSIAIRVNAALREKQISQKSLADTMGVSPQQVNKIVKGRENLTLQTISKLEKALGLTLMSIPSKTDVSAALIEESIRSSVQRFKTYQEIKKHLVLLEDISQKLMSVDNVGHVSNFLVYSHQNAVKKPLSNMITEYVEIPKEAKIIKLSA